MDEQHLQIFIFSLFLPSDLAYEERLASSPLSLGKELHESPLHLCNALNSPE